jgi:hypothetical protein
MPDDHCPEITQLTTAELDRYANQLTRCLKALDTRAPIRARVQHELAEVRAEQDRRGGTGQPAAAQRHYDAAGLTAVELERTRRAGSKPGPGTARLIRPRADPGTDSRHRRRACCAGHTANLNGVGLLLRDARHDHLRHLS